MCGICGVFGKNDEKHIRAMTRLLAHRGPDDTSYYSGNKVELGHNRLGIIDLSEKGNQPLSNEDGSIWITFNGEIYNFEDLRGELEAKGHKFKSKTDTETIIHAYEEYGIGFANKLDGMFAFGLYDGREGKLVLARDRVGVKPLYYTLSDNAFLFASEIKALLNEQNRHLKDLSLDGFFGYNEETPFPDVKELLPGHTLEVKLQRDKINVESKRYWSLDDTVKETNERKIVDELAEKIENSVKQRLVSDVPIGLFLSGGLDSSLIAALAKKYYKGKLMAFCVGTERSNEFQNAQEVAGYLGIELVTKTLSEDDIVRVVPNIIYHLEDCDPRNIELGIMNYYMSKSAREHGIKVILTGEGPDEIFGGYEDSYHKGRLDYIELVMRLHSNHLKNKDRVSMANAVELRVPYLDNTTLLEYSMAIDTSLKVKEGVKKYILRQVAKRYLPRHIAEREKGHGHVLSGIPFVINDHFGIPKGGSLKARFDIYKEIFRRVFVNGENYKKIRADEETIGDFPYIPFIEKGFYPVYEVSPRQGKPQAFFEEDPNFSHSVVGYKK